MMFNINNEVRVQLTAYGREVWKGQYDELNKLIYPSPPLGPPRQPDAKGWLTEQLWTIMNVFGPCLYMGGKQVFKHNIIVLEDEQ
jgi:hypothetical protein